MNSHRSWQTPAIFLAVAALVAGLVLPTAAASARGRHPTTPKPTIVLVHGAWADASSWAGEISRLQRKGYTVAAPPNPLRSVSGDSEYLRAYLATISGPIVLVGHSYGGTVVTNAATGNPNVKALVYVDAFAPAEGESILDVLSAHPGPLVSGDPATTYRSVPIPSTDDVDLYLSTNAFSSSFAPDVARAERAVLAASQRPLAASVTSEPSGPPAWGSIPSWFVIGTEDQVILPAGQEAMAARAHSTVVRIKASHASPVSQPNAVSQVILAAAES